MRSMRESRRTLATEETIEPRSRQARRRRNRGSSNMADTDPDIEALQLIGAAKDAAYTLKRKYPTLVFTSGRRSRSEQAQAMARNVLRNRQWIAETYAPSAVQKASQAWVDANPDANSPDEISGGLE